MAGFKSLSDRARSLSTTKSTMSILEFAESPQGLGIKLFPAQKFFLKVFEKEDLDDQIAYIPLRDQFNENVLHVFTERQFYDFLRKEGRFTLDYEIYQRSDTTQINLCMGRRASKTTIIGVWIAYKLYQILNIYHPQKWFGILPRDPMNVTMTALGGDNADRLFKRFVQLIKGSPFFSPYFLEDATTSQLKLWTQYDLDQLENVTKPPLNSNSISIFAEANSPGVRGENNVFIVGDEFAHFNKSSKSTRDKPLDQSIYDALVPSTSGFKAPDGSPFGKALFISSPNGKVGKFYEDFQDAITLGAASYTLGMQCATWEVNPSVASAFLRKEYNKNTSSYDQEYGGKFISGGQNWIHDLPTFYASFDRRLNPLQPTGRRERLYFLGVDFALSNDGTACSLVHYEPFYEETPDSFIEEAYAYWRDVRENDEVFRDMLNENPTWADLRNPEYLVSLARPAGRFIVDYSEVRYAGRPPYENRKVLLIDEVLDWVQDLYFRWPIKYGCYDQWSGEIINQMVQSRGFANRFEMIKFNQNSNDSMYKLFSTLLHQNELKMPPDTTLINELLSLRVELREHGIIKVEVPNGAGHDDRFDSIIRALYMAYSYQNKNFVLAGQSLQNLFNQHNPVMTTGDLAGIQNPQLFKKMQTMYHQSELNIRSPNLRQNQLKIMSRSQRPG